MELGRTKFIDLARVPVYVTVKLGGSKVGTLCGLLSQTLLLDLKFVLTVL